jgi:four helix bundle protein
MNNNSNKKYDLEDRLIEFAALVIKIAENLKNSRAGNHISGQLVRSGTSPALNYGEAQSAESCDFIHNLKFVKGVKRNKSCLKIVK